MIRILCVITTAFVSTGGLTSVMMNYYRHINHDKFIIDFASSNPIESDLLHEINLYGSKYFQLPKRKSIISYFLHLRNICKYYDVIHVHANSATAVIELYAAKYAKVKKRLIHIHTSKTEHPYIHKILAPFFHNSYTDKIACSEKAGKWIFNNEFKILPNAIDCEKYVYPQIQNNQEFKSITKNHDLILGHIGKFMNAKNHLFLIRIFKEISSVIPQAKLLLVGDGYLRKDIESEISKYNLQDKVILAGMRKDIPQLLSLMDIFIFPSLWEGLPLSVLEAQSSGLQCILSDNITKEVALTDLVSYLSLQQSEKVWADFIIQKIKERKERTRISQEAIYQITKKGYNIKNAALALEELYLSKF